VSKTEPPEDPNWPADLPQDARWPSLKLIVLAAITLILGIGVIYTAATVIGEHPNRFSQLDG
jgi:hypothetical protein